MRANFEMCSLSWCRYSLNPRSLLDLALIRIRAEAGADLTPILLSSLQEYACLSQDLKEPQYKMFMTPARSESKILVRYL